MCAIPDALVLSFEPGLNARAGIYAQKVTRWTDMKFIIKQLEKPEVHARYKCICFDTIELAANMCQEFVCQQAGVQSLADVGYGKLYKAYELEFGKVIRGISMLGYGCVFAAHTEVKELPTDRENITIERLQPKLDKRAFDIINGLVDIIGVGVMEFDNKGNRVRKLYTQETPTVKAGNRFSYFPPVIDFSYQAILDNLTKAIEEEESHGACVLDHKEEEIVAQADFASVREEAQELWTTLVSRDENNASIILKKIEMTMGHRMKLSEFTEDQCSLLELVVSDMRDMI